MNEFKIEIKWGIIVLLFRIVWLLMEYLLGIHSQNLRFYNLSVTISFAFISIIMIMAFREKVLSVKEKGSFFVLFFFGVIVSAISIIIYAVVFQIYLSVFNTDLPQKIAEEFAVYNTQFAVNKSVLIKQNISKSIFFSMLTALILSLIFKRKTSS